MIEDVLLKTAVEQFGQLGLDGASTRAIAQAAGTAMSSITYHYGGKEGLYLAAVDYIVQQMRERIAPVLATMPQPGEPISPQEAQDCAARLIEAMARIMIGEHSACHAAFIVREQLQPTAAFERLYSGIMGEIIELLTRLAGAATGIDDPVELRLIAMSMAGQALSLRSARAAVHKALGVSEIGPDEQERICLRIRRNIQAILTAARNEP